MLYIDILIINFGYLLMDILNHILLLLWMEKKFIYNHLSIALNILGYTIDHGLRNRIVMISSSKNVTFGLVVFEK